MQLTEMLKAAVEKGASDIFIVSGLPLAYKINNSIQNQSEEKLYPDATRRMILEIYELASQRDPKRLLEKGDDDFSFSLVGVSRFRVSTYKQRGSLAAVIRVVKFDLPDPAQLGVPQTVLDLGRLKKGLVLVTGPAGSGKSTTLACMIDLINRSRNCHVITLEDPIEYLHSHKKSVVSQREISNDTESYVTALRAALRQAPNVILLGEMRDYETISTALTAAETGHLVFSTLHTVGAANTIDRVIDAFPPNQQPQIRVQLSMVLQAVVSQQLIPAKDGSVAPAFEIMKVNGAIRNMIRESKVHQIDTVIYSSAGEGMISMDASILELYRQGKISAEEAMTCAAAPAALAKKMGIQIRVAGWISSGNLVISCLRPAHTRSRPCGRKIKEAYHGANIRFNHSRRGPGGPCSRVVRRQSGAFHADFGAGSRRGTGCPDRPGGKLSRRNA